MTRHAQHDTHNTTRTH